MSKIIKIKSIGLSKFNNAEYTNFSSRLVVLAESATISALGIPEEDWQLYKSYLEQMRNMVAEARTSDYTAKLAEIDSQRDALTIYMMTTIRAARNLPLPPQKEAAISLFNIVKPYMSLQTLPNQQQTVQTKGLLIDLEKSENKAKIALLGLTETVSALDQTNNLYDQYIDNRTHEKTNNKLLESKAIRIEMDTLYDKISTLAFVKSISAPTETTALFIRDLNALIDEVRTLHNLRVGLLKRSANNREEEEENTENES